MIFAREENRSGKVIKIGVRGKGSSRWIFLPESEMLSGWDMAARKIRRFVLSFKEEVKKSVRSFKDVAKIPPWPNLAIKTHSASQSSGVDFVVEEGTCREALSFLDRCLVGRVGDLECPIPTKMEVQKWVDQRWKTAGGVRVVDMSGKYFLFEFPSKEEASRILVEKCWSFNNLPLFIDKWNMVGCCHREDRKPREAWVRALGLPLHLWGSSVFKKIGDCFGGFLKIDKATESRNDLRWARILVRFSNKIPACVRIGVDGRIFEVPIWAETTTFCRPWRNSGGFLGGGVKSWSSQSETRGELHIRGSRAHEGMSRGPAVNRSVSRHAQSTWKFKF